MSKRKQSDHLRQMAEIEDQEMKYEAEREEALEKIQVRYFDEDPNGNPDRHGSGWYCQWEGLDAWIELHIPSGSDPYDAEDAAIEAHRQAMEDDWEAWDEAESRAARDEDYLIGPSGP